MSIQKFNDFIEKVKDIVLVANNPRRNKEKTETMNRNIQECIFDFASSSTEKEFYKLADYDFLDMLLKKGKSNDNALIRIFEWYLDDNVKYNDTCKKYYAGETEETELAKNIYSILWDINISELDNKTLDMDVMNSFWTTYKEGIFLYNCNKPNISYSKRINRRINDETFNELLNGYGEQYAKLNEKFNKFAELTHTIGNFTVEHKGFNIGRKGNDYWDYALELLKEHNPLEFNFKMYVEKFYMRPYVYNNYEIAPFWDNHKYGSKPSTVPEIEQFLDYVEVSIKSRGSHMIRELRNKILNKNRTITEENPYKFKERK